MNSPAEFFTSSSADLWRRAAVKTAPELVNPVSSLLLSSPFVPLSDYGNMLFVPLLPHFIIWVVFRDLFHLFLDVAPQLSGCRVCLSYLSFLPFTSSSPVGALLLIGRW